MTKDIDIPKEGFNLIIKSYTLADIKELVELLEDYVEEKWQEDMMENQP